jgi:hypothetical protein
VGQQNKVLGTGLIRGLQSLAQFRKAAGRLGRPQTPGTIAKDRHGQDGHAFERLRAGEIERAAEVGPAVGGDLVETAVDTDAAGVKRPVGIRIAGEAAGTKRADPGTADLSQQIKTQPDQRDLLIKRVIGQVLTLPAGPGKGRGRSSSDHSGCRCS